MAGKTLVIIGIIASLLLGIIMQQFSPTTAGPLGILFFFGLLYVIFLVIFTFVLYGVGQLAARLGGVLSFRKPVRPLGWLHAYYFATVVGLLPVILLGMQSVGGIGFYEVLLVGLFGFFGCFYVAKKMA